MIEINVLVPYEDRTFIDKKESESFRIISTNKSRKNSKRYYAVETTEEEATFLTLKYGSDNVWKR